MTAPDDNIGDEGADGSGGDVWMSRRVPPALGAVSDAVLDALGDVTAMAASEARRDAETRLATSLGELEEARLEAQTCRLRMEKMAAERAALEAEIESGMAAMEASMARIRSALVRAAVTPGGDVTGKTGPETEKARQKARGEPGSGIGAAKPVRPDADAGLTEREESRPDSRPEPAQEAAKRPERTSRSGRASKQEHGISAGSVPPEIDAGIISIIKAGEFPDWPSATVALLGEALADRASRKGVATGDTTRSGSDSGTRLTAYAGPDAPRPFLNGATPPTKGSGERSGIP